MPGGDECAFRKDANEVEVNIHTARPGIVIGKSGVEVDALRKEVHAITQKNVHININEIKRPELDAKLVAQSIAEQLQNRVSFRRAMTRSLAAGLAPDGIRVNAIAPGFVATESQMEWMADPERAKALDPLHLLPIATPEQIAPFAVYLASD